MKWLIFSLIFVLLGGMVFAFSTCRSASAGGRVEITLFCWPFATLIKVNRERIAIYEKEHPHVKIRLVSGDEEKYLTMVTGGVAPDIAVSGPSEMHYYARRNAILPLDDFIEKDKSFSTDDFFPVAIETMRYRGKIYGLPDNGSPVALIYNKEMFDRYNKAHPEDRIDYPNDSWTWDDFRHAAKALTKDLDGDGQPDVYGTIIDFYRNRFPIAVWSFGGEVISKDKRRCLMDSPQAIAAVRMLRDIIWVDKSAPSAFTQFAGVSEQSHTTLFREERVAMIMSTRYLYDGLLGKTQFEWDVGPLPKGPAGQVSLYIADGWIISSQSLHPDEVWKLAKFLVSPLSAEIGMRNGRGISCTKAIAKKFLCHPGVKPPHECVWIDMINVSRPKDFEFRFGMGGYFSKAMNQMYFIPRGQKTPEQVCKDLTAIFNKGLKILWEEEGGW
ncbi:MAG: sugar ABC transporter substrate-binding protein [Planctomycetes bacterium]|nr:sugar ABC transporter substrate-binding protein [Planctomycetota bacterium]